MTQKQLYWLAGWLEGEGTFYYSPKRMALDVQAFSTDKDVIEKAVSIANARIYEIKPRMETTWNRLIGWRFDLQRAPAAKLMRSLLPLMGQRRQQQITMALSNWENRPNKPARKLCACGCGRKLFGGPRVIYARRNGACAQVVYRKNQRAA